MTCPKPTKSEPPSCHIFAATVRISLTQHLTRSLLIEIFFRTYVYRKIILLLEHVASNSYQSHSGGQKHDGLGLLLGPRKSQRRRPGGPSAHAGEGYPAQASKARTPTPLDHKTTLVLLCHLYTPPPQPVNYLQILENTYLIPLTSITNSLINNLPI